MAGTTATRHGERGVALVLAILALLLLTFMGLTLAVTTSVELQIATNYRWAQQALYNAEAGIEVGRVLLSNIGDASTVLPPARAAGWDASTVTAPVPEGNRPAATLSRADAQGLPSRNFANADCDTWGNGAGYGAVLDDGVMAGAPFQNVSNVLGRTLNGTFTLWVRRRIIFNGGQNQDDPDSGSLVLTSEGTAPYQTATGTFVQTRRAVRVLEAEITLAPGCLGGKAQSRQSGFAECTELPPPPAPGP